MWPQVQKLRGRHRRLGLVAELEQRLMLTAAPFFVDLAAALGPNVAEVALFDTARLDADTSVVAARIEETDGDLVGAILQVNDNGSTTWQAVGSTAGGVVTPTGISPNAEWLSGIEVTTSLSIGLRNEVLNLSTVINVGNLGLPNTSGYDVSTSGIVVGATDGNTSPFRWNSQLGIQVLPQEGGGIAFAVSSDGSLAVGFERGNNQTSQAVLWNGESLESFFPNQHDRGEAQDISPNGQFIGGSAGFFNPDDFRVIDQATVWIHNGPVFPTTTAANYTQVLITDPAGEPLEGEVTAVTDNGLAFIEGPSGGFVYDIGEETLTELDAWLVAEGIDLPTTPTAVAGAHYDLETHVLSLAVAGSAYFVAIPMNRYSVDLDNALGTDIDEIFVTDVSRLDEDTALVAARIHETDGDEIGVILEVDDDGTLISNPLGSLTGAPVTPTSISPNGQYFTAVESTSPTGSGLWGVVSDPSAVIGVGSFGFPTTGAWSVSNNGDVVGSTDGLQSPYRYDSESGITVLEQTGSSSARSISADGTLIAGFDAGFPNIEQAVLWNENLEQSLLPNQHDRGIANYISPSGEFILGSAGFFSPDDFRVIEQATVWIHNGPVFPTTTAENYTQVLINDPAGEPLEGEVRAVTDAGLAFINGPQGAFVYDIYTETTTELGLWLAEQGVTLPATPAEVRGAHYDPEHHLLTVATAGPTTVAVVPYDDNQRPEITLADEPVFDQGDPPQPIASTIALTDVDNFTLTSATITLDNVFDSGAEFLAVDVTGTSITQDYNESTGELTLSGLASVATYETVLRSLTYQNTAAPLTPEIRTVSLMINDGSRTSFPAEVDVYVYGEAPVWQNDTQPADVDGSGSVNLTDALEIVASLRNGDSRRLSPTAPTGTFNRIDVDGNNRVTLGDALAIISLLRNTPPPSEPLAEGESPPISLPPLGLVDSEDQVYDAALLGLLAEQSDNS